MCSGIVVDKLLVIVIVSVTVLAGLITYVITNNEESTLQMIEGVTNMEDTLLNNGSPPLGSDTAPVTIVEFGDYQCHFCNVFFHSTHKEIIAEYIITGDVKMIFKDYNIIGPDSVSASHGAHCAGEQDRFWEYHDTMYSHWTGENNGWASPENLAILAKSIDGLDIHTWTECVDTQRYAHNILASNNDARKLNLGGTPAFFVFDSDDANSIRQISGAQPFDVFESVIQQRLSVLTPPPTN